MAIVFVSCHHGDNRIVRALEAKLVERGHSISLPFGTPLVGDFRAQVMRALVAARAFVAILTRAGEQAQNVLNEMGAARALALTKGMLVFPVPFGVDDPPFVRDLYCYRLESERDEHISTLADQLHDAILSRATPRIFISHRHEDRSVAAALIDLLKEAFHIENTDVRCTSLYPYALTPGVHTSEQIRTEIAGAELVLGILTPNTKESNYVVCELGAAWGRHVASFPILVRGAQPADIPAPLNELSSISLEIEASCLQLVGYVARNTSLQRRNGGDLGQYAARLAKAAGLAQSDDAAACNAAP